MYINFDLMASRGIDFAELIILQAAKQNTSGRNEKVLDQLPKKFIKSLIDSEHLHMIKGSKKDSENAKIRTTKKGNKLLEDLETPEVLDEDLVLFDWISKVYKSKGKEIGNKRKTKMYIALFRAHSGIEKNELAILMERFVKDDDNMEFNHKLEYALFKPATVYQAKFDIEQSRLYLYYLKNREYFDYIFKKNLESRND